jgi:hypothetical protein
MPRTIREGPRRAGALTLAVIVVVALGWLAGTGAAGPATQARTPANTVVSTDTETVTHTVTAARAGPPRRAGVARTRRTRRTEGLKRRRNRRR